MISILVILIGAFILAKFNLITEVISEEFVEVVVGVLPKVSLALIVLGIIGLGRNNKNSLLNGRRIGRLSFQDGIFEYRKVISQKGASMLDYVEDKVYEIEIKNIKLYHKSLWQTWIIIGDFKCRTSARNHPFVKDRTRKCLVVKIPNYYEGLEEILKK